jgi:hypothetical protein
VRPVPSKVHAIFNGCDQGVSASNEPISSRFCTEAHLTASRCLARAYISTAWARARRAGGQISAVGSKRKIDRSDQGRQARRFIIDRDPLGVQALCIPEKAISDFDGGVRSDCRSVFGERTLQRFPDPQGKQGGLFMGQFSKVKAALVTHEPPTETTKEARKSPEVPFGKGIVAASAFGWFIWWP